MRAVLIVQFGGKAHLADVPDPTPAPHGVVVAVEATGVCRSDWHAWQGHDDDVVLPHVPGHELAGTITAVGADVRNWTVGQRVTTPFVTACGACPECAAGAQQVCRNQTQPGFTGWGSFAELVALPEGFSAATAAALGCRVATAFRAVSDVAAVKPGEFVAVHGAGGVGLSAIAIAAAAGARVVAVDPSSDARELARSFGAEHAIAEDVVASVHEFTEGGAHVSIDAVGLPVTCENSVRSLRRRGRHVQIGLLPAAAGKPAVPMDLVIAGELQVLGSHGMAAHDYPRLLSLVASGRFPLADLVTRELPLEAGPRALAEVGSASTAGITVLTP